MLSRRLEAILSNEAAKTDLSRRPPGDMQKRFDALRGCALLPTGRGKNSKHLSIFEISAGVLSIATVQPGFAGTAAIILRKLLPVGGSAASFESCRSFGEAIEALLTRPSAYNSLIEVRISDSEIYTNSHCRAAIDFLSGETKKTANYVGALAVSLLQPGAEKTFDPRKLISTVVTETILYPSFFRHLHDALEDEKRYPAAPITMDPDDDAEEHIKEERAKRLGLTNVSKFLNVEVDTQVTWPNQEAVVEFEGKKLILLPRTREHTTSIHIDLTGNAVSSEEALTIINRFLSLLTWCDDQFAVLKDGWSGNPVPVPVLKGNLAFNTTPWWVFNRQSPVTPEARRAIAIYRDGRNAEQNYLISYAILCYYKIIEIRHKAKTDAREWFRTNLEAARKNPDILPIETLAAFDKICGKEEPGVYLFGACRSAVAHANKPHSSDPDDYKELRRLNIAADILRILAREFIIHELGVSESAFDGT